MLPGEIEPFADHHIDELGDAQAMLDKVHGHVQGHEATITLEDLENAMTQIRNARNALIRFKVCMADEVTQKNRYATYAKAHGYPFS